MEVLTCGALGSNAVLQYFSVEVASHPMTAN